MPPGTPGYPIHATQNSWLLYPCHLELLATLSMPPGTPGYPIHATRNSWLPFISSRTCDYVVLIFDGISL